MRKAVRSAQPLLSSTPPKLNRGLLAFARLIAPLYVRRRLGIHVEGTDGIEHLIEEYRNFFSGKTKPILVFRHVLVHDAQIIFYLVNHLVRKEARKRGIKLEKRPHAHFLYGRGVPLWAGRGLNRIFSRFGAIPVARRSLDRKSIEMIRRHIAEGPYPIALAPEGQVTYHNRKVFDLEPGFAQIALWAEENLLEEQEAAASSGGETGAEPDGKAAPIHIVPISQHYRYGDDPIQTALDILDRVEEEAGSCCFGTENRVEYTRRQIRRIGGRLLTRVENFYRSYYRLDFPVASDPAAPPAERVAHSSTAEDSGGNKANGGTGEFSRRRVENINDTVLSFLEQRLGIEKPYSSFVARIFTIRTACWNRIFTLPPGGDVPGRHSPSRPPSRGSCGQDRLKTSLGDYIATEADLLFRHLELTDILTYLQPEYGMEEDEPNMLAETALNIYDITLRLRGGDISDRPDIRPTYADLTVGKPISLEEEEFNDPSLSRRTRRSRLVHRVLKSFEELSQRGLSR